MDTDLVDILVNISYIHNNVYKIYDKIFTYDYNKSTDLEFIIFIQNNIFDFLKSVDFPNVIVISYNTSRSPISSICVVFKVIQISENKCSFSKLQ